MRLFIFFTILSFLVSSFLIKYLLPMLASSKYNCLNFRNKLLPAGTGLLFPVVFLITIILTTFFHGRDFSIAGMTLLVLLVLVLGLALLGLLDDLLGDKSVGGFKGHFGELARGNLTTGSLKAIGGGLLSFFAAAPFSTSLFTQIINTFVIALFINTFNLLDLRPGRALKVFLILGLIVSIFLWRSVSWSILGIFIGPAVVLLWVDLTERGMLGDVGSNVLGGVVGFISVANFNWTANLFILIILVIINVYSESNSISMFIERNFILRWLDELGRKKI
ncbi:hypothetical protein [Candidatus Oleimmundimicrobium sp.]|uniref:hypothetical protein n=1 Tax=Candidatus Oleimmundimicrobium sp. TaxID=3060597 RepID=UPI00271B29C8|nr:hypothetical protein [Candidatus Oleimmundimicrobium sp.]MDO8886530.1 hypothetical protein [Candidatus Oleimmundimicrobium sp.]